MLIIFAKILITISVKVSDASALIMFSSMKDFSSLLKKVASLKAKVEQNSITPLYLGAILDDFISAIQSVDMTDMADDISTALSNAAAALATAKQSLDAANAANTAADAATSVADTAVATANAAKQATDSLAVDVTDAQTDISAQGDAIVAMQDVVDVVKSNLSDLQGALSTHTQSAAAKEAALHDSLSVNAIVAFDGSVGDVSDDTTYSGAPIVRDPNQRVSQSATKVYFSTADSQFLIYEPDEKHYYSDWDNAYLWQDANGLPYADKAYYNINNGRLYQFVDSQLCEIALTQLQDNIGIVSCIVRNASPAEIMTGYPVGRNYTIWWSQTDKQFYAAVEYDYNVNGVMIELCNSYKISAIDNEDRDVYEVYNNTSKSYVPRTDRIYRDRTQLYRYDASSGKMVALFDTSIINSENIVCSGSIDCNDFTAAAGEINGNLLANSLEADGDVSAANVKTAKITPASGSGGVVEVDGLLVTKDWGVVAGGDSTVNGNLFVNQGVYAQGAVSSKSIQLDDVEMDTLIVREFHGIRNSIPDGVIATTEKVTTATQGGLYDIVYIRTLKRFVALTQTAYAARFSGDDNYNVLDNDTPKTARTDRVWRWDNDLYKLDPKGVVTKWGGYNSSNGTWTDEFAADLVCISDNGFTEFVRKWRETIAHSLVSIFFTNVPDTYGNYITEDYGGYFPEWAADEGKTPGFYINGIYGISYAEARAIYDRRAIGPYPPRLQCGSPMRTNLCAEFRYTMGGGNASAGINTYACFQSYDAKVIRVGVGKCGQRPPDMQAGEAWLSAANIFYDADKLEEVIGAVQLGSSGDWVLTSRTGTFQKLKYFWIKQLSVSLTRCFVNASDLDIDCLRYLVEYSRATSAKPISVTLHPDLFARLTDDILELAETKYVTFVSA